MAECMPYMTLMEERLKLMKTSTAAKVDVTLYRSIVGGLRYLIHTRPHIAFVVGYVSRFMEDPREGHWAAVKQLQRYVKGTVDHGINFSKISGSRLQLTVFSDADMAEDIDGRRSTSGVLVFFGSALISWLSLKQKPAIALVKNPVLHDRSKHIDVKFHFLKDCVDEGQIVIEFVETGRQLVDVLTKLLGRLRLMELKEMIGMKGYK
ncbi:secreted RxLR effector protein 161-like [Miscanthus floridulus]|uniref:secreted RxLR effector protein 161-like n=1 Tax=Miscanthus floridulus TaxID=154761 RepID=UPI0034581B8A